MNKLTIEEFAEKYPVGAKVRYYNTKRSPVYRQTVIRSEPWALGHGEIVVKVNQVRGGVSIDHIEHDNGRPCVPPKPPVKPVS